MSWQSYYKEHSVSMEELVTKLPHEDVLCMFPSTTGEPKAIFRAMTASSKAFRNVTIASMMQMAENPFCSPEMQGHFNFLSFFNGPEAREPVRKKQADFTPIYYHQMPKLIKRLKPEVAILHLSPPDENGWCSFGVLTDYQRTLVETAQIVVAQVNRKMPRTLGKCFVHVTEIDWLTEISEEIPTIAPSKTGPVEMEIGKNCAALIRNADCLQLGIGSIPDAVLKQLTEKRDLGLHSEMLSDGIRDLMESGIMTNRYKKLDPFQSTATFAMGSDRLYQYIHNNPAVNMSQVDYTNDPYIICQQENMVTINSALQIDLMGQVAADTIGPLQYSGVGGQVDFVRGANMARNGRNIIALPSTARKGTVSRISVELPQGGAVTTSRHDVDYVVTEYGVAQLWGKTLSQRAEALIAIAHPDFRERLKVEYQKL